MSVARTSRRTRATSCCSFCSQIGHTVRACSHTDVQYLFHEFMYFYMYYGEQFLCNNLTALFQPEEALALLYFRPISDIRVPSNMVVENEVVDLMMPRAIKLRYTKLHKKILTMATLNTIQLRECQAYIPHMNTIEPVMRDTVTCYELEHGDTFVQLGVMVSNQNIFTMNRHARFNRYDYDIQFQETMHTTPIEGEDFAEYMPPSFLFQHYDTRRYGRARDMTLDEIIYDAPLRNTGNVSVIEVEEMEPEWLNTRSHLPPPNVTVRSTRRLHSTNRSVVMEEVRLSTILFGNTQEAQEQLEIYERLFEDWSNYTRMFDHNYKYAQPDAEIELITQPPAESVECPICMTEVEGLETVSLGCCVYSFCGDCYSKQYMTKEHREHKCMMCRAPFSKVCVFQKSMADKLKPKLVFPDIPEIHDVSRSELAEWDVSHPEDFVRSERA